MGEAATAIWMDYGAYLALEQATDQKHEWFNGQVYAMAGGTLAHGALAFEAQPYLATLADARQ